MLGEEGKAGTEPHCEGLSLRCLGEPVGLPAQSAQSVGSALPSPKLKVYTHGTNWVYNYI